MARLHRVVLYRGIDADSYRLEWMVKQALLYISKHYMLKFDFTPIIIPQLENERAVLKVDEKEVSISASKGLDALVDEIINVLLGPSILEARSALGMPLPPQSLTSTTSRALA